MTNQQNDGRSAIGNLWQPTGNRIARHHTAPLFAHTEDTDVRGQFQPRWIKSKIA